MIGPFLRDQRVQYVKGFYKRPIRGRAGCCNRPAAGASPN